MQSSQSYWVNDAAADTDIIVIAVSAKKDLIFGARGTDDGN